MGAVGLEGEREQEKQREREKKKTCSDLSTFSTEKKSSLPMERDDQPRGLGPVHGRQRRQQPSQLRRPGLDALLRVELDELRCSFRARVPLTSIELF